MSDRDDKKPFELSRRVAYRTPYFSIAHERYTLPREAGEGDYYYVDIAGSTMIVAEGDDGRLVLVRQHRYIMGRTSLEFPGGGIAPGLDPLQNARQELREEAGYQAERWQALGRFAPCNGLTNELCHVFVARELRHVGAAPEATEDTEVVLLTPDEVRAAIDSGELWDGQAIAAFSYYALSSSPRS